MELYSLQESALDQPCDPLKATSQGKEGAQAPHVNFPLLAAHEKERHRRHTQVTAHTGDSSRLTYEKEHGGCWVDEPPRPVGDYCRNQDTARDSSGDDQ